MRTRSLSTVAVALAALTAVAMAPTIDVTEGSDLAEGCRLVDLEETPEDASDDVTICEQQLFVRAGDAPVSNIASAVFSTDAPTAPLGGAGLGGSVTDIALQGDPSHGLEVNGSFEGAVDTIDIEVYVLMPNGAMGGHGTTPTIEIDGAPLSAGLIDTTVSPGANGIAKVTFSVDFGLDLWGMYGFGFDPEATHTLRVNLSPFYIGDDGAYLYDGTNVPSNVLLNAAG